MPEAPNFYMVWTKTGPKPTQTHETFGEASASAIRSARRFPGKKFTVLKAVANYRVPSHLTPPGRTPAPPPEPRK